MNKSSFLKATLYIGVMLLLFIIAISFNTLRVVTINGTKTIRTAHDRFKLDTLESQIKDAIRNSPRGHPFTRSKVQNIDEKLIQFEQQLAGQKLPTLEFESVKKKWDQLQNQSSPEPTEILQELDLVHKAINENVSADIAKREASTEKDISRLTIFKILLGAVIFAMVIMALYLDTIQTQQKNELIKRLQEFEKKTATSGSNSFSSEALHNLANIIGHDETKKIIQAYLAELPKAEESLNRFLLHQNLDEIHQISHHNISPAQTIGAEGLADLFKQLEQTDQLETANELNSKINQEAKIVVSKLEEQLH